MNITYISYWSLLDPLCQTQCLAYIKPLTRFGYKFSLITFEQKQYMPTPQQIKKIKKEMADEGIYWYPLKYHKKYPLLATAYDCLRGTAVAVYASIRHKSKVVHSRSSIPASMALPAAKICGLKFLYDADSRLSEEYVESGHWSRESNAFKATAFVEEKARKNSEKIIVLTEKLKQEFKETFNIKNSIMVIPCCVDMQKFSYNEQARNAIRSELKLNDELMFVYVGKRGSWYAIDEMFEFYKIAQSKLKTTKILIITPESQDSFLSIASKFGVEKNNIIVRSVNHDKVTEWLSAADVSLAFIYQLKSKIGSSPVKVGEYLSVGLPVVITDGIGDYSELIKKYNVGCVLRSFDKEEYNSCIEKLQNILSEDRGRLRERCRKTAVDHASLSEVGIKRYRSVYKQLMDVD